MRHVKHIQLSNVIQMLLIHLTKSILTVALADPGGAPGTRPSKGPDSFILTYKVHET